MSPTADPVAALYQQYGPVIFARCARILGDEALAADATQEAFLRLHRVLRRSRDVREGQAWVARVATNHCLSLLRERRRRGGPDAPARADGEGAADTDAAGLEAAGLVDAGFEDALHRTDAVRRLAAGVPVHLAEVAWLHHVDGLTQQEVAEVLGVSRRTVVYRLTDFLEAARALLGQGRTR